jgi:hypothetical protein
MRSVVFGQVVNEVRSLDTTFTARPAAVRVLTRHHLSPGAVHLIVGK